MPFRILSSPTEVAQYVDRVRRSADSEKNSFGFLPESAYEEVAAQGKLFVAVGGSDNYLGHVMFGGKFPHRKIMQTYCIPEKRKQNVASGLIQFVVEHATANAFLDLKAMVRDDLAEANKFYESMGFQIIFQVKGGATRGRMINIRVRELDTPNLFDRLSLRAPSGVVSPASRFGEQDVVPIYAIDLNVLFDVGNRRDRKDEAGIVLAAGMSGEVRLVVAEEFIKELERAANDSGADLYLQIARQCKQISAPKESEAKQLMDELGKLVFPGKFQKDALRTRDRSDVMHLATAIYHEVTGFITSDKTILRLRGELFDRYSIDVLGVSDFADLASDSDASSKMNSATADGVKLEIRKYNSSLEDEVCAFLLDHRMTPQKISEIMTRNAALGEPGGLLITTDSEMALFAHWRVSANPRRSMSLFICMNEQQKNRRLILDYALGQIFEEAGAGNLARIDVKLLPGHALTRAVLLARGFQMASDSQTVVGAAMEKVLLGGVLTERNWTDHRISLKALCDLDLPSKIPAYEGVEQAVKINIKGRVVERPLFDLETILSPGLILLPGRGGIIVPIQRKYADDLLGTSPQTLLFDSHQAQLWQKRTYYCTTRARARFERGAPILFYESSKHRGRSAVVAVARVTDIRILTNEQMEHGAAVTGVLDTNGLKRIGLSEEKLVVQFDNVLLFPQLVSYKCLEEIGCVSPAQLVTAERVRYDHLLQVIEQGFRNAP